MAVRMSKDDVKLTVANALTVADCAATCDLTSVAQPVWSAKSDAVEAQIAAGEAFMARYRQTFEALAK